MIRDTELKLYNAIDLLEAVLHDLCLHPAPGIQGKITSAKDLVQEAIADERKITDGH